MGDSRRESTRRRRSGRRRRRARRSCSRWRCSRWRCWRSCGGGLREAELKIDGLVAKSAQQERQIAHLERFNAQVLEEKEELRRLLAKGALEA